MEKAPEYRNRRVLVIDDNRTIHDDFRKILAPGESSQSAVEDSEALLFGNSVTTVAPPQFELESAYQGQEGVALVGKAVEEGHPYAMAFVDVRMPPGWDGIETTQKMWDIDPDLQIVICTAYSDYSWGEMSEKIGRRGTLLMLKKPFDAVEVLQLAQALTEKWDLHRESRRKTEDLEGRLAEYTNELQQANRALQKEVIEHQRAEESLRLFQAVMEQAKDSIVITDAEINPAGPAILFINPAFTKLTGYTAEEAVGKTSRILREPPTEKTVLSQLRHYLKRREAFECETISYRKDGEGFMLEWQITPIRNSNGTITHFVAVQRDITARKRFEAQMFQSQKMETVGKLAGGIAHEFNSLLTAIIGQSELIHDDLPAVSPLAKNAAEIKLAANRAASLTRQLLAYGRKQFLNPETIDLNQVIAGMESMIQHLLGCEVTTQFIRAPDLPAAMADVGQIEQVIMNLVMNAREAMPNGGKLTLETSNDSLDEESVKLYPELKAGKYVALTITDSGTGMSEEVKAHLFEPFFTTKDLGQGTGLGLSTCYGIIKQSGGHISAQSQPGKGSSFKFYLPQTEKLETAPVARSASPALPGGEETLLLIEDDPVLREMSASLLSRLGYTVFTAANGAEALHLNETCATRNFDALLTEIVMKDMSGHALADRIQTLHPKIRILFTSANKTISKVDQELLDKGAAFLPKPYTPLALAQRLREVLDQHGGNHAGNAI